MPFEPKNASQSFQPLMDRTFADVPAVFVYLDDNLLATATIEEHLQVSARSSSFSRLMAWSLTSKSVNFSRIPSASWGIRYIQVVWSLCRLTWPP